jgi:hypothetical protein
LTFAQSFERRMNEKCMIDGRDFKRERESESGKNKERKKNEIILSWNKL